MDVTARGTDVSTMIRLSGVGKTYPDGTVAVHELDLEVRRGELVVLVGPSGCGKSTTLKMINRLIEPTTGTIEIDGQDVTRQDPVKLRRSIGYVIQQIGLFPHQKIVTNVMTVPLLYGETKATARERAHELMTLVGLDPDTYSDRYPHQLSGGQRQRVGVARALAADPPVLLMDEPFGAVDPVVRVRLQDEFLRLQRDLGKTVVLVTHDIDEAVRMGDRVAVFATGGRLAQYATPAELLGRPADDFVADFVGLDPRPAPADGHADRPEAPRAAGRDQHRRPRRRDRRRRLARGGAGRPAPRRPPGRRGQGWLAVRRRTHPQRHPPRVAGVVAGACGLTISLVNQGNALGRKFLASDNSLVNQGMRYPTATSRCQDSVTYFVFQPIDS